MAKIDTSKIPGYAEMSAEDKLKALELLGKHFGMFTDNVRLSGDAGVQIIDDIPAGTD